MQLTLHLPPREQQLAFNRKRWSEVLADRGLAELPYRIETNAYGQILMTPPASGGHSHRQGKITVMLDRMLGGNVHPECPISTIDGVKAADVGWYSDARLEQVKGQIAFEVAPEICVEVLSPGNSESEMRTKRQLYFDAGADEVWICGLDGTMTFYQCEHPDTPQMHSTRCAEFPTTL
ncbi:Uma2 family endonuclease [Rhodopirellula sallentina]|uniref:Protein containing DUF820 n=1 Tax=Rhodopirellula sallentina SM41 TaxID=1263870 RepID=M5U0B1_9BACT|nr:Uma2 family endonuclease [Rhodopirellula sallentina]EMI54907.1 protein containing DUF820 [Rhodopirellula sallentina SM41]